LGDLVLSMARYEAFGRDVFDALARGCLVGCLANTAVAPYVEKLEAGSVFEQKAETLSMAAAISRLRAMRTEERAKRGRYASRFVCEAFSEQTIARQWDKFVRGIR
jgi:glycosyltransferase involved in cell wall biosynthesis